jgi:hypothetical protein
MLKREKPGSAVGLSDAVHGAMILGLMGVAAGCNERDRLTFPGTGDGIGPVTLIDQPIMSDTTVDAGPNFFVNGRTIDSDGVDTVYFLVAQGNQGFPPFVPRPAADTVRFGLPINTAGLAGDTIQVQIHGVDSHGNRGADAVRRVFVR